LKRNFAMQPGTTEAILELMQADILSAALGAAMELGLFWQLAEKPSSATAVAQSLDIPLNRCQLWLQILCQLGLLEQDAGGYVVSKTTREAILNTLSQAGWAFQAREERLSVRLVRDLSVNLRLPMSDWQPSNHTPTDYFQQIQEDPGWARRFTHKLYEIHLPLAEELANLLDLEGVKRLIDLGGGSGVVSMALLRKSPELTCVVVDVEGVCQAGREIARENQLEDRITYLPADFLKDELPVGFDMLILCDVGEFSDALLRRIQPVLNPNGRLVIVDKFALSPTSPPPSRLQAAFLATLEHPSPSLDFITAQEVQTRLQQAGFREITARYVPHRDNLPWNLDWTLLEACK
jgi:predicted O-methyltransferase YrrM